MEGISVKWCCRCSSEKPVSEFFRLKKSKTGFHVYCKVCMQSVVKKYRLENQEKVKAANAKWRAANAEKVSQGRRNYWLMNKEWLSEYKRANYQKNRDDRLEYARKYREENPGKISALRKRRSIPDKERYLVSTFGMTLSQRDAMIESQGGGCAICGDRKSSNGRSLVVDHCHDSSVVRGILCDHCNRGLGFFRDRAELLAIAIEYLSGSLTKAPKRIEPHEVDSA